MNRRQLEHIIRAAAATADVRDIVVIGSQAILGAYPNAPTELTLSMEAYVFPKDEPQRSIVIDGAIGELSLLHSTFGYHAHGVDQSTAVLPEGWQDRLVKVESPATMGAIGWCLEPHDLAVAKLVAGREKDIDYAKAMLRENLVAARVVRERLTATPNLPPQVRELANARLDALDSN